MYMYCARFEGAICQNTHLSLLISRCYVTEAFDEDVNELEEKIGLT